MIEGVNIVPLKKIKDERGMVMHMLRADDPHFEEFGEIYFSVVNPGIIKGWHLHNEMKLNYAVVSGKIKLVLYDQRENSKTKGEVMELFVGKDNYVLVQIPTGVVNAFKGLGETPSIIANCASIPHKHGETIRIDLEKNDIPYDWKVKGE